MMRVVSDKTKQEKMTYAPLSGVKTSRSRDADGHRNPSAANTRRLHPCDARGRRAASVTYSDATRV